MKEYIRDANAHILHTRKREGGITKTYYDPPMSKKETMGSIHNPPKNITAGELSAYSSTSYGIQIAHLVKGGDAHTKAKEVFLDFAKNTIKPALNTPNKDKTLNILAKIGINETMTAEQMAQKFLDNNQTLGADGWRARASQATITIAELTHENLNGALKLDESTAQTFQSILHETNAKRVLELNKYGINPPLNADFIKVLSNNALKADEILTRGGELGLSSHEMTRHQILFNLAYAQGYFGPATIKPFCRNYSDKLNQFFNDHKDKEPTPQAVAELANFMTANIYYGDNKRLWPNNTEYKEVLGEYFGKVWNKEQKDEYSKLTKHISLNRIKGQESETANKTKKALNNAGGLDFSGLQSFIDLILDFLCEGMGPFGQKLKEMFSSIFGFDKKAELSKDEQGLTAKNPDGTETKITKAEIAKTIESNPLLNELAKQYKLDNDQAEQVKFLLENKSLTAEVMPSFNLDKELEKISKGEKLSTQAQIALFGTQAYQKLRGLYGDKAHPTEIKEQCAKLEKIANFLADEKIKSLNSSEIANFIKKSVKENGVADDKQLIKDYSMFIVKVSDLENQTEILNAINKETASPHYSEVMKSVQNLKLGGF